MRNALKTLVLGAAALLAYGVGFDASAPGGLAPLGTADAVVGRPLTPVSYAGVARRTTYRHAAYTSAAVATTAAVATSAAYSASAAAASASASAASAATSASAAQASGPPIGTIVTSLPQGCQQMTMNDISYYNCGGTYFRTAFQGNNLVYVVSQP